MDKVEAYIAGVKELSAMSPVKDWALYHTLDDQLLDMWVDMSDGERDQAYATYKELWPQR